MTATDLTVRQRADAIATFRHVNVFLMETLARWVPTTPELEVKVLFGRHLWDFAQHADAFGHRTAELRLGLQASREPAVGLREALQRIAGAESTAARLQACYARALPMLRGLYCDYLDRTDRLLDEPSVRILERALTDLDRLQSDRRRLGEERSDLAAPDGDGAGPGGADAPTTLEAAVDFRPAVAAGSEVK